MGARMGETITREVRRSGSGTLSKRWLLGIVAALVVVAGVWLFLLIRHWPFKEQAVITALQDRFARQVEIRGFRLTYFPPGGVATGVSFLSRKRKDLRRSLPWPRLQCEAAITVFSPRASIKWMSL